MSKTKNKEKLYAFYSHEMAKYFGTIEWIDKDGNKVICTGIDDNYKCDFYNWDDKQLLGEVERFNRRVTKSPFSFLNY